jgi:hypothetical protein
MPIRIADKTSTARSVVSHLGMRAVMAVTPHHIAVTNDARSRPSSQLLNDMPLAGFGESLRAVCLRARQAPASKRMSGLR